MPTWWLTVSGIYFLLASIFMLGLVIIVIFLVRAIVQLSERVKVLSGKVEGLLDSAKKTSDAISPRIVSISKTAEGVSANIGKKVEIIASIGLALFAIKKFSKRHHDDH